MVTQIGQYVIDTINIFAAQEVVKILQRIKPDTVRGVIKINDTPYCWSTYQQFKHHGSFRMDLINQNRRTKNG